MFDGAVCAFEYRFPLDALMRRFKYAGDLVTGRWLALQLLDAVSGESPPDVIVVPPSTRRRLRERGFNPALEIAKPIARHHRAALERSLVVRAREDEPQAGLSRAQRHANLRGAFRCPSALHGADVVVVDDVMTTTATARAMAAALDTAGAARVRIWAVARTPDPGS